jgi:hypothetical protein
MANEPEKCAPAFILKKKYWIGAMSCSSQANVKSRNEFVTEALGFTADTSPQKNENYLLQSYPPSLSAPVEIPKTVWHEWISKSPPSFPSSLMWLHYTHAIDEQALEKSTLKMCGGSQADQRCG